MHITDSTLQLSSQHALDVRQSKYTFILPPSPNAETQADPAELFAQLFSQQLRAQAPGTLGTDPFLSTSTGLQASETGPANPEDTLPADLSFQHGLLVALLEMLLGVRDLQQGAEAQLQGMGMGLGESRPSSPRWQFVQIAEQYESETCEFSATGKICLADGSERQFSVDFTQTRSESQVQLSTGSLRLTDPLVLDFGGSQASLDLTGVSFDLNSDGAAETLRMPTADSALLFLDRNRNGQADNGLELFGPQTGNGFGELATLDGDGNGWLDSADASFADLKLWRADGRGQSSVSSLGEAGIGALSTQAISTPFSIKENGQRIGQQQASSVWVGENSGAGVIRQVDLATSPANSGRYAAV